MDNIVTITNKFGNKFKTTREKAESMFLKGIIKQEDISEVEDEPVIVETIEELQKQYEEKFQNKVPANKKNDYKWIKSKLSSN